MSSSYIRLTYRPTICLFRPWGSKFMPTTTIKVEYYNGHCGLNNCHGQLQMNRYLNETQQKLQTIPQTMTEAVKGRILTTSLPPNARISNQKSQKKSTHYSYIVTSIDVPPLTLPSVSNSSACSSHCHGYTICTSYTLFSSYKLWPFSPNPAIMQTSRHFSLSSRYSTCHTMHIYKQLYIATLLLSLDIACSSSPP